MKSSSLVVLLAAAPLFMVGCSKLGTGVEFDSFASSQAIVPVVDGQEPEVIGDGPGAVDQVPIYPGEEIDDDGNLVTDDGEVIVPACDAKTQAEANLVLKQEGSSNVAGVSQTGSGSSALIYQKGDSNVACVVQVGDNNKADVKQTGSSNSASVSQTGNGSSATIVQTGGSNSAVVVQK